MLKETRERLRRLEAVEAEGAALRQQLLEAAAEKAALQQQLKEARTEIAALKGQLSPTSNLDAFGGPSPLTTERRGDGPADRYDAPDDGVRRRLELEVAEGSGQGLDWSDEEIAEVDSAVDGLVREACQEARMGTWNIKMFTRNEAVDERVRNIARIVLEQSLDAIVIQEVKTGPQAEDAVEHLRSVVAELSLQAWGKLLSDKCCKTERYALLWRHGMFGAEAPDAEIIMRLPEQPPRWAADLMCIATKDYKDARRIYRAKTMEDFRGRDGNEIANSNKGDRRGWWVVCFSSPRLVLVTMHGTIKQAHMTRENVEQEVHLLQKLCASCSSETPIVLLGDANIDENKPNLRAAWRTDGTPDDENQRHFAQRFSPAVRPGTLTNNYPIVDEPKYNDNVWVDRGVHVRDAGVVESPGHPLVMRQMRESAAERLAQGETLTKMQRTKQLDHYVLSDHCLVYAELALSERVARPLVVA